MNSAVWWAACATAVGTLLIRMLPLYLMQRRLSRSSDTEGKVTIPAWPSILAPLMIAALLGVSLAPQPVNAVSWVSTLIASLVTLTLWYKTRTLGLPVAAGVAAYAPVLLIGS
ncbi:AzlD domain-containing protein [Kushneria marisflavi]|uniref:Branched-chain amino acid ABC transporter n=1 Tax=Kushneria marisflavi TaxID=157779 RepID=A0A240UM92_9GAMM|nr:AzlD domain-containing protein [Kushneria marisflavi]ART62140.1 branched-chain amino acid ABC transporter [Kushneria marisflavi]RKD87220.1 branched-subunit amino acid transport protein AzlD [Kushneria marisflavi]